VQLSFEGAQGGYVLIAHELEQLVQFLAVFAMMD
jgi:hypothetical protein